MDKALSPCTQKNPRLTAVNCSFNHLFRLLPKPVEWLPCSWVRAATMEKSLYLPARWAGTPAPRAWQCPGRHVLQQHGSVPLCKRMSSAWKHLAFLQPQGTPSLLLPKVSPGQPVPAPRWQRAQCSDGAARGCTDLRCAGTGTLPAECAAALRCAWETRTATEY